MKHTSANHPWLLTLAAAAMATIAQAACSEETGDTNPSGGGGTTNTTSSTSGGGGTTSSSSSSSTSTSTTIQCNSVYSDVPVGECDLLQQDCPVGMGCEPAQDGDAFTTVCVSEAGLKDTGQDCNPQSQECMAGLACVLGKCSPVCCEDNNEPCEGGDCNVNVNLDPNGAEPIIVNYCSFLQTCDLFDPTHCDSGALGNCYPYSDKGYAVCAPPSQDPPAGDGEPCDSLNSCADNMACINPGECRYTCLISNWQNLNPNEGGCPVNQTCGNANFNIPDVGVCVPG